MLHGILWLSFLLFHESLRDGVDVSVDGLAGQWVGVWTAEESMKTIGIRAGWGWGSIPGAQGAGRVCNTFLLLRNNMECFFCYADGAK